MSCAQIVQMLDYDEIVRGIRQITNGEEERGRKSKTLSVESVVCGKGGQGEMRDMQKETR